MDEKICQRCKYPESSHNNTWKNCPDVYQKLCEERLKEIEELNSIKFYGLKDKFIDFIWRVCKWIK